MHYRTDRRNTKKVKHAWNNAFPIPMVGQGGAVTISYVSVQWQAFQSTIKVMYPVVKEIVDEMCQDAKDDM